MPRKEPTYSYTMIRNYAELFQWTDPSDGQMRKGFNPPSGAENVSRVPFYIKYVTGSGKVESGTVTCISVQPERLQRKIKFEGSGEIRIVYDYLIVEIDGVLFLTH